LNFLKATHCYRSANPDSCQNLTDPEHWFLTSYGFFFTLTPIKYKPSHNFSHTISFRFLSPTMNKKSTLCEKAKPQILLPKSSQRFVYLMCHYFLADARGWESSNTSPTRSRKTIETIASILLITYLYSCFSVDFCTFMLILMLRTVK
jgi:hypothetical protein